MVCSSSDSEGRSLKVLSSRPGASREKRRARWGRGVASSGSAVLAGLQGWRGPSAPVESVTASFCETLPLFWLASASARPAQKQQGSLHKRAAQWALSEGGWPRLQRAAALTSTLLKWNQPHRQFKDRYSGSESAAERISELCSKSPKGSTPEHIKK